MPETRIKLGGRATSYSLICIDWSKSPFSKWERLWAVFTIPYAIYKFIMTGKCKFCHKEVQDG